MPFADSAAPDQPAICCLLICWKWVHWLISDIARLRRFTPWSIWYATNLACGGKTFKSASVVARGKFKPRQSKTVNSDQSKIHRTEWAIPLYFSLVMYMIDSVIHFPTFYDLHANGIIANIYECRRKQTIKFNNNHLQMHAWVVIHNLKRKI